MTSEEFAAALTELELEPVLIKKLKASLEIEEVARLAKAMDLMPSEEWLDKNASTARVRVVTIIKDGKRKGMPWNMIESLLLM